MRLACIECGQSIEADWVACPHCGRSRVAPACPDCGDPVSTRLSTLVYEDSSSGREPWNRDWIGSCESCGTSLEPTIKVGDHARGTGISSQLRFLSSYDSTFAFEEEVETPTITIRINRTLSENWANHRDLLEADMVTLTHDEIVAIADAVGGSLSVLLARESSSKDLT